MRTTIAAGSRRIGRVAALAAVVASGLVASAGPVAARPAEDGASTLSASCSVTTDRARTYYGIVCDSFWPWDSVVYRAWARCTDNLTHYGAAKSSSEDGTWSIAQCPAGRSYTNAGYDIWE
jgi:hypothetical protein